MHLNCSSVHGLQVFDICCTMLAHVYAGAYVHIQCIIDKDVDVIYECMYNM